MLYRDGGRAEDLGGSMLTFPAVPGETVVVVPEGSRPQPKKIL